MDNRGKAAALVGLSAIGGILAYYGISQYGNEKEDCIPGDVKILVIHEKHNIFSVDEENQLW